jgi:RNA polymerase sigma-70 factor (ECF subfamily)
MHEVKGYDHREIANLLSCSVGNSKSQLHRAKAKMRELMASKRKEEAISAVPEMAPEQSWEPSQAVA